MRFFCAQANAVMLVRVRCNFNSYRSTWSPINLLWKLPINFAGCSEMQDAHLSCNFLWPASWLGLFLPFNCFLLEFPLLIVWLFYQQIPISYFCDVKSARLSALFTITRIYEILLVNYAVMSYLLFWLLHMASLFYPVLPEISIAAEWLVYVCYFRFLWSWLSK